MADNGSHRIAQIIRLKRSSLQQYKDIHASAWPAVLKQIKDCNISDYSIYLDKTSMTLFATMKYTGSDFEGDMEKMKANPEVRRWWEMTDAMQETLVEGSTGSMDPKGWWRGLEEGLNDQVILDSGITCSGRVSRMTARHGEREELQTLDLWTWSDQF
ncbi:uncharacterized protein LTR77_007813 [Saxophila tyrrhenica]|uniref:DUF718 domain protein n=1 Tax=Saxophila tyrrhenica TaxID=1690608 RepID=A0AAV9P752_9PEZI|nr:hypothetical protein LTR77_007813 [Saxophila tyrrhenica]